MSYTKKEHSTRILSVDYGDSRIGLAISDVMKIIAKPYKTIKNLSEKEVLHRIKQIVKEKNVEKIIVGLPITLKNTYSQQTKKVQKFVSYLDEEIDVPVLTYDERLTSVEAKRSLTKQGVKLQNKKGFVDMTAAAIFLQGYLDEKSFV